MWKPAETSFLGLPLQVIRHCRAGRVHSYFDTVLLREQKMPPFRRHSRFVVVWRFLGKAIAFNDRGAVLLLLCGESPRRRNANQVGSWLQATTTTTRCRTWLGFGRQCGSVVCIQSTYLICIAIEMNEHAFRLSKTCYFFPGCQSDGTERGWTTWKHHTAMKG